MTSLSINKNKEINVNSTNTNRKYQKLNENKKLISTKIDSLKQQIKAKYDIINSIKNTKSRWMINKLNKDINKLNENWTKEQTKLVKIKPIYKKYKQDSILTTLEQKTNIPATIISTFNKVFISILLSVIPLSICYLLLNVPYNQPKNNSTNNNHSANNNKKNQDITNCLNKLKINRYELADKLKISNEYLEQLEMSGNIPEPIKKKINLFKIGDNHE
jgi:peptidoglycan hydrolase CwlO-like protein